MAVNRIVEKISQDQRKKDLYFERASSIMIELTFYHERRNPMSLTFQKLKLLYPHALIHEGAQIPEGCRIDEGCEISGEAVMRMKTAICKNTRITGAVEIGMNVVVRENVTLIGPLVIEDDVFIGHDTVIGSAREDDAGEPGTTLIGKNSLIGREAEILAGCQIGRFAKIRAGSRVMGDVPEYGLAGRSPAILERFACPQCGGILSVQSVMGKISEMKCQGCGQAALRMNRADLANTPGHVLLPHGGIGTKYSLLGDDLRWLGEWELR
jgi:acetyltransferase-like isoleucine patch superfamily enzyme